MATTATLPLLGLAIGAAAVFCALWTVVPAPSRALAFLAVGASEWSLWLATAGAVAAALGLLGLVPLLTGAAHDWSDWRSWRLAGAAGAVVCGLLASALAVVPPLVARPVAEAHNVSLSLPRALFPMSDRADGEVELVTYASPGGHVLQMDVYRSANGAARGARRPGVIVVHGGAWNSGRRSENPRWNHWLAAQGYVVFDVDYRLAPQPNWESATADVQLAVETIRAQATRWGVDPQRLALLGRSAGGHLALLAAYTASDQSAQTVRAVVSLYGPTDLIWGYEHPANQRVIDGRETLRRFLGGTPQTVPDAYRRASPITHVRPSTPPTLLLHGERDQYVGVQHARRLSQQLARAGVPHETVILPHAQHGFDFVFDGWGGQIAQGVIARFLHERLAERHALGPPPSGSSPP